MISVSTAIMVRLLCVQDGHGCMLLVPGVLPELAGRVCADEDLLGWDHFKRVNKGKQILVLVDPLVIEISKDIRKIPVNDLRVNRKGVHEVLMRIAVSGWKLNPLLSEELAYLQEAIQDGPWSRGLVIIGEVS